MTKLSLLLKVLEGESDETLGQQLELFQERALPNLDANIKCGNSLIGPDYFTNQLIPDPDELRRVNPFDWAREFPLTSPPPTSGRGRPSPLLAGEGSTPSPRPRGEQEGGGGFDCIIGNPPYIRMETFRELKSYLKANYASHDERSDLYAYFIERAHKLLNKHGRFGMIVSNKFLRANYGKPLRDFLHHKIMKANSDMDKTQLRATVRIEGVSDSCGQNQWDEIAKLSVHVFAELVQQLQPHNGQPQPSSVAPILDPFIPQGTELPTEAHYVISNAHKIPAKEIKLHFGDNEPGVSHSVSLGPFNPGVFPTVSEGGPSYINVKVSISSSHELCIAILDTATKGYRSIGFVDLAKVELPAIITHSLFEIFSGNYPTGNRPHTGNDISYHLTISFDEALYGVQIQTEVVRFETCPTCTGSGVRPGTEVVKCADCQGKGSTRKESPMGFWVQSCPTCEGTGQIIPSPCITCEGRTWVSTNPRPFIVDIPSGIDSGAQICLPGQGEPGQYGGRPGHLCIIVTVAEHPLFTRIGHDISIHLPVSEKLARTGGQLRVPGVEEESFFLLSLPPNTRSGAVFRVVENESYTLNAVIDTYNFYNLIGLLEAQDHLRAIKKALNRKDFVVRT